jgi:hypothetical protein
VDLGVVFNPILNDRDGVAPLFPGQWTDRGTGEATTVVPEAPRATLAAAPSLSLFHLLNERDISQIETHLGAQSCERFALLVRLIESREFVQPSPSCVGIDV